MLYEQAKNTITWEKETRYKYMTIVELHSTQLPSFLRFFAQEIVSWQHYTQNKSRA